jgi:hypothetical protein
VSLQRGAAVPCTSPSISLSALSAHLPWTIETHGEIPHSHGPAEHCRRGRLQSSLGNAANGGAERSYLASNTMWRKLACPCQYWSPVSRRHRYSPVQYRISPVVSVTGPTRGRPQSACLPVPNRRRQASAGREATMTPLAEARNTSHQAQLTAKPGLAFVPLAAC